MFGLGIWEIAVIAVVALLVLGPQKLPEAAKSLGKALRDFRRAGDDLKREMMGDVDAIDRPKSTLQVHTPPAAVPVEEPPPVASTTGADEPTAPEGSNEPKSS